MYIGKYILGNKKRSFFTLIGITLSSVLLFSIGIIISSFRGYLIKNIEREVGSYHVIVDKDISSDVILKKEFKDDRYFITYKNIYRVYQNTEKLCDKKCDSITYNDSLLSLYGISKNENALSTFKQILYFLTIVFGIIIFLIIYNSFSASIRSRREDICRFKLIGLTNLDLYKLYLKEALVIGILGIILGFIISILLNFLIISIVNNLLYEIFNGNLKLNIYFSFVIIPFIFMLLIIILSIVIPLRFIGKYSPMELFRKKDLIINEKPIKVNNFVIWFSLMNYRRSKKKYRGLILCIFIAVFSVNVFFIIFKYITSCMDEFTNIPNYDLHVNTSDDYDLNGLSKKFKAKKSIIFKSCTLDIVIEKENFIKGYSDNLKALVTNTGGNSVINKVDKIVSNGKIKHIRYRMFKKLDSVIFKSDDDVTIDNLSLKNDIPFGFDNVDDIIINLDNDKFDSVCPYYTNTLIMKTDYSGIDNYLNSIIKNNNLKMTYLNVKKSKQLIENVIIIVKLFLYLICILIICVMVSFTVNITSMSMLQRKYDLSVIRSIGLERIRVNLSLLIESLIVSFKGWFYCLPFMLFTNKFIFKSISRLFDYSDMIILNDTYFYSLIISFLCIYLSMFTANKLFDSKDISINIKDI